MRTPPGWLYKLFTWCMPSSRPDLVGDFLELYELEADENKLWKLNTRWFFYCLGLIRLKILIPKEGQMNQNIRSMLNLYLKIGRRNFVKNKLYSFINVFGLSVGLTVCMLITLFVRDELSYDKHFNDYQDIFRITGAYDTGGDVKTQSAQTTYLLKPLIKEEFKEIEKITRVDFLDNVVTVEEQYYQEDLMAHVDSVFFDVFEFQFKRGKSDALYDASGAVVTQEIAEKYFGEKDPMGKMIQVNDKSFYITGIIENPSRNSHFQANIFLPLHGVIEWYPGYVTENASGYNMLTYFKSTGNLDPKLLSVRLNEFVDSHWTEESPDYK